MNTHPVTITPTGQTTPRTLATPEGAPASVELISGLITKNELTQFVDLLDQPYQDHYQDAETTPGWQPVSTTGMSGNYQHGDEIGSWRLNLWDENYAHTLFERISNQLIPLALSPHRHTREELRGNWTPVGINPYLRLIRYNQGGWLVPHYDGPHVDDEHTRSLRTLVIYLDRSPDSQGGATRFLHDTEEKVAVEHRDGGDRINWRPTQNDVAAVINADAGCGLVFDHRILHDGEKVDRGNKLILRTDIMYTRP